MILTLVFSRDRALQLQATLASLALQVADPELMKIAVLYRATTSQHSSQYDVLRKDWGDRVQFVSERDFRAQLLDLLLTFRSPAAGSEEAAGEASRGNHCLFVVDDCIFIRPLALRHIAASLASQPDVLGVSLRLGRNTTFCYSSSKPQALPRFLDVGKGLLKFHWPKADGDFGYPLEISSSLYRLDMIQGLARGLQFDGPSSLESQLSLRARGFARSHPAMICFEESVAFSAPLNRVQAVFQNRVGTLPALSTDSLADLFDQGKRINVSALSGFTPRACHEEIEPPIE